MKITLLGASGSGKTVYLSAIGRLFFNQPLIAKSGDCLSICSRDTSNYENRAAIYRAFEDINSLCDDGTWPRGTNATTIMPTELQFNYRKVIDIDFIDYRGGILDQIARIDLSRVDNEEINKVLVTLLASDAIAILLDANILMRFANDVAIRQTKAVAITNLAKYAKEKGGSSLNIYYFITKCDSSTIDLEKDKDKLVQKVRTMFYELQPNPNNIICVGAVGVGNVITTTERVGQAFTYVDCQTLTEKGFCNISSLNIASSIALILRDYCLSHTSTMNKDVSKLKREFDRLNRIRNSAFGDFVNTLFFYAIDRRMDKVDFLVQTRKREAIELKKYMETIDEIVRGEK